MCSPLVTFMLRASLQDAGLIDTFSLKFRYKTFEIPAGYYQKKQSGITLKTRSHSRQPLLFVRLGVPENSSWRICSPLVTFMWRASGTRRHTQRRKRSLASAWSARARVSAAAKCSLSHTAHCKQCCSFDCSCCHCNCNNNHNRTPSDGIARWRPPGQPARASPPPSGAPCRIAML
jgi:hypothetical protein